MNNNFSCQAYPELFSKHRRSAGGELPHADEESELRHLRQGRLKDGVYGHKLRALFALLQFQKCKLLRREQSNPRLREDFFFNTVEDFIKSSNVFRLEHSVFLVSAFQP